jgi:hypothetical protein
MSLPKSWEMRRADSSDALAIAVVHIGSWQAAYRGIVPKNFLDGLDAELRASRYTFHLSGPGDPVTWIADDGAEVVGFVTVSPSRDEDLTGFG